MKKGFLFTIDPSHANELLVRLEEVQEDGDSLKWLGGNRKLYRDTLLQLSSDSCASAVRLLLDEKRRSLQKIGRRESEETMDLRTVPIDSNRSIPILKSLAATGRLYFKRKPLIANFFAGASLFFSFNAESSGKRVLKGIIKTSSKEFDLSSCYMLVKGEPYWLIHEGCLRILKGDISWKWMKKVYEAKELSLTQKETEDFFDTVDSAYILGEQKKDAPLEPKPVLSLSDPRGIFANLFMEYPDKIAAFDTPLKEGRNKEAEELFKKDLLEAGYIEKRVGAACFYCPADKVSETLQFLLEIGWKVKDLNGCQVKILTRVDMAAESEKDAVLIKGKVFFEGHESAISDITEALKEKRFFISLGNGTVGLLSKESIEKNFSSFSQTEIVSGGVRIKKYELAAFDELYKEGAPLKWEKELIQLQKGLKSSKALAEVLPGKAFVGKLRKYQKEGVSWLSFLFQNGLHGILADDMGLGKTVQVLAFLSTIESVKPLLIVMPRSLLFHWRREIEHFLPKASVIVYHGVDRDFLEITKQKSPIVLTSYSTLRKDTEKFEGMQFSCIILDESQAIKNRESKTAKAIFRLQGDFRLSMTGTPVENHLGEIASQFQFLIPGLFRSKEESENPQSVKKKVRPFILRRKKSDVDAELPEKIEQVIWLEMGKEQKLIYDRFLSGVRQGLLKKVTEDGVKKHRIEIFEACLRLRQICCHPLLFESSSEEVLASVKTKQLLLDLETLLEEGQKALVFSQFTSMLQLIAKEMNHKGWTFAYLDGKTKEREAVVNQFQNDPQTNIFLISLKAGGVGMNLTKADYVFLYDPWWNEAVENQAIDRAHRIGRERHVIAKRYLIRDTIEERMMQLKSSKSHLAESLFDAKEGSLLDSDLEFLLQ